MTSAKNFKKVFICLYFFFALTSSFFGKKSYKKEYCAMEDFKPTCGENTQQPTTFNNFRDRNKIQALNTPLHNTPTPKRRTAVRITKAFYGRMQLGRCIKKNFGYLGCYHDVTHVLNSYCAGSLDCHVRVPDAILEEGSVCTEDLTKYLSVQYECFEVFEVQSHVCQLLPFPFGNIISPNHYDNKAFHNPRYNGADNISNPSVENGHFPQNELLAIATQKRVQVDDSGDKRSIAEDVSWKCHFRIVAQPGQLINISVFNFNHNTPSNHPTFSSLFLMPLQKPKVASLILLKPSSSPPSQPISPPSSSPLLSTLSLASSSSSSSFSSSSASKLHSTYHSSSKVPNIFSHELHASNTSSSPISSFSFSPPSSPSSFSSSSPPPSSSSSLPSLIPPSISSFPLFLSPSSSSQSSLSSIFLSYFKARLRKKLRKRIHSQKLSLHKQYTLNKLIQNGSHSSNYQASKEISTSNKQHSSMPSDSRKRFVRTISGKKIHKRNTLFLHSSSSLSPLFPFFPSRISFQALPGSARADNMFLLPNHVKQSELPSSSLSNEDHISSSTSSSFSFSISSSSSLSTPISPPSSFLSSSPLPSLRRSASSKHSVMKLLMNSLFFATLQQKLNTELLENNSKEMNSLFHKKNTPSIEHLTDNKMKKLESLRPFMKQKSAKLPQKDENSNHFSFYDSMGKITKKLRNPLKNRLNFIYMQQENPTYPKKGVPDKKIAVKTPRVHKRHAEGGVVVAQVRDTNGKISELFSKNKHSVQTYSSVGNTIEIRFISSNSAFKDDSFDERMKLKKTLGKDNDGEINDGGGIDDGNNKNDKRKSAEKFKPPVFLLSYQVVGCPTYAVNKLKDKYVVEKMDKSSVLVRCKNNNNNSNNNNNKTGWWRLSCQGDSWQGQLGECHGVIPAYKDLPRNFSMRSMSTGISAIVVVTIATAVGMCVATAGIFFIKNKRREGRRSNDGKIPSEAVMVGRGLVDYQNNRNNNTNSINNYVLNSSAIHSDNNYNSSICDAGVDFGKVQDYYSRFKSAQDDKLRATKVIEGGKDFGYDDDLNRFNDSVEKNGNKMKIQNTLNCEKSDYERAVRIDDNSLSGDKMANVKINDEAKNEPENVFKMSPRPPFFYCSPQLYCLHHQNKDIKKIAQKQYSVFGCNESEDKKVQKENDEGKKKEEISRHVASNKPEIYQHLYATFKPEAIHENVAQNNFLLRQKFENRCFEQPFSLHQDIHPHLHSSQGALCNQCQNECQLCYTTFDNKKNKHMNNKNNKRENDINNRNDNNQCCSSFIECVDGLCENNKNNKKNKYNINNNKQISTYSNTLSNKNVINNNNNNNNNNNTNNNNEEWNNKKQINQNKINYAIINPIINNSVAARMEYAEAKCSPKLNSNKAKPDIYPSN